MKWDVNRVLIEGIYKSIHRHLTVDTFSPHDPKVYFLPLNKTFQEFLCLTNMQDQKIMFNLLKEVLTITRTTLVCTAQGVELKTSMVEC